MRTRSLLTTANPKTAKGEERGWLTAILHLAPHTVAGGRSVCPASTKGCRAGCLFTAGRAGIPTAKQGGQNSIISARIARTRWFLERQPSFITRLAEEIAAHAKRAKRKGFRPAVRLNGTSDIAWEVVAPELFAAFPDVRFYDYTKREDRGALPSNYYVVRSRREADSVEGLRRIVSSGRNVVVVFGTKRGRPLPCLWNGMPVFDGDRSDLRFLDPRGWIVGVRAKGKARRDRRSGFVVWEGCDG